MVKFLSGNDTGLIFNYLNKDCSALLSCIAEYYTNCFLEDGVFAMQYGKNEPVSLLCRGGSFSLVFASDKSDFNELLFTVCGKIHSPNILPFTKTGEYYLLKKTVSPNSSFSLENKGSYGDFKTVIDLNKSDETVNLQYLFKKGCALPFVSAENGEKTGGGIIVNSENYTAISHIFVKEEFRRKGIGTQIVKNLLSLSKTENVYLISEENNLEFYGRLGFAPVLTVNKYDIGK